MEIFHSFQEITGFTGAVVALGTFDGVHRGHQMVMKTAIKRAAACGVKTMVVTFMAHPLSVLCPEKEPLRLATIGQKAEYIEAVGIDGLVLLPMSQALLQESPEEFCQNLLTYIHPSAIVVGSNFTYGAKAAGNTETMKFFMSQYDIPVVALTLLERPGRTTPISSTIIFRIAPIAIRNMGSARGGSFTEFRKYEVLFGKPLVGHAQLVEMFARIPMKGNAPDGFSGFRHGKAL